PPKLLRLRIHEPQPRLKLPRKNFARMRLSRSSAGSWRRVGYEVIQPEVAPGFRAMGFVADGEVSDGDANRAALVRDCIRERDPSEMATRAEQRTSVAEPGALAARLEIEGIAGEREQLVKGANGSFDPTAGHDGTVVRPRRLQCHHLAPFRIAQ